MNLRFNFGYKSDFNVSLDAVGSRDFTNDEVDSFVSEFFTFDKFKCRYDAFDFAKPTDIIPTFGLKCDVSSYLFSEGNLYYPFAVDNSRIDILVTVYNSATRDTQAGSSVRPGNYIVQYLGAISPSDRQCEFTKGEGTRDSHSFTCDLDSAGAYYDITGCVVEDSRNSPIHSN